MVVECGGDLVELSEDGLTAEASAVLVVPAAEGAGGLFEFTNFPDAEAATAAWWFGGCRGLEPSLQGVQQRGAGHGGRREGARCGAAVHH